MPNRPSGPEAALRDGAEDPFPWPFTARDTPEVRRRVAADLRRCVAGVGAADPALRALVLTGGFARGEGTVLRGAPQNDYDLVALRGPGAPRRSWAEVRAGLERALGLHVDLQPVWVGRLPWVRRSIFWYETALRGKVLWGDPALLARVPVRDAAQLAPGEGLRLLANRAAGLVLHEASPPGEVRLQAAKALLAALDVHLLARGAFAPSQRERWQLWQALPADARPPALRSADWLAWAIRQKLDPPERGLVPARDAWQAGAEAVLGALPAALRILGAPSLAAAARRSAWVDDALYRAHALRTPGLRPWVAHPTARLRAATLRLLAERAGLPAPPGPALAELAGPAPEPAPTALARLRAATPT